jgi:hypothetical protein
LKKKVLNEKVFTELEECVMDSKSRIVPLNLPARVRMEVAGNPVTSRLESSVANCFPGLEMDHRNLDRRFFPGLVFEFVTVDNAVENGAKLVDVDLLDPDIKSDKTLVEQLDGMKKLVSPKRNIYLQSLEQQGRRISLVENGQALTGLVVWRLVRSLQPGKVTIELAERAGKEPKDPLVLTANRRIFQGSDGLLSPVYRPGELGQSLCSPWQHDFRDCACFYWASNHPDIVLPDDPESHEAETPILWMRFDQRNQVKAQAGNSRRFEMDYFEINTAWQELAMVLEGRELLTPYAAVLAEPVEPLPKDELPETLRFLAGVEHALALEYLYARYAMKLDEGLTGQDQEHVEFIAHELLVIAASEMMHLRWVNQLLWELWHQRYTEKPEPALHIGQVPGTHRADTSSGPRPLRLVKIELQDPSMRPITEAIDDFIAAEKASGTRGGLYAKVFATLQEGYPAPLAELVSRIIADGLLHFSKFQQINALLKYHENDGKALVRDLKLLEPEEPEYEQVRNLYRTVLVNLKDAYSDGNAEDRNRVSAAREAMQQIDITAKDLAAKHKRGIDFIKMGGEILKTLTQ